MFDNTEQRAIQERKAQRQILTHVIGELKKKGTLDKPDDIWGLQTLEQELEGYMKLHTMQDSPIIRAMYHRVAAERLTRISTGDNNELHSKLLENPMIQGWYDYCFAE